MSRRRPTIALSKPTAEGVPEIFQRTDHPYIYLEFCNTRRLFSRLFDTASPTPRLGKAN
jgi:hypothetical protein